MTRSFGAAALAMTVAAGLCGPAAAAWPDDRPIEVIVGYAPGGATDVLARKLGPFVEKRLGGKAKIIVINRPGASGEIANAALSRAAPDGYTLGVINLPSYLFVPMIKKMQYDPADIRPVARIVDDPTVAVVRANSPYTTLDQTIEALRKKAGSVSFGHNGIGTNGFLTLRLIDEVAKVKANDVPYRGSSAQKTDLMGGHLDVALMSAGEVPELHGDGKGELRVIAQFMKARSPAFPGVPTAEQAGLPVVMTSERGFAAPKGVPEPILGRLEAALAEAVRDPEFVTALAGESSILAFLPGPEWQESMKKTEALLREMADRMPKER